MYCTGKATKRLISNFTNAFKAVFGESIQNYGTDNENYGYTIIDKEGVYQRVM